MKKPLTLRGIVTADAVRMFGRGVPMLVQPLAPGAEIPAGWLPVLMATPVPKAQERVDEPAQCGAPTPVDDAARWSSDMKAATPPSLKKTCDILEILRAVEISDSGQIGRLAKRAADEIERLRPPDAALRPSPRRCKGEFAPMKITYRTRAEPPKIGEWIRSTRRPRYAYFVVGLERKGPHRFGGRVGLDPPIVYKVEVERRPASAPAEGDVVHPIHWDSRG